jgi:regulator of protease activity HflC (stomatin/prohibitin superfamily)
MNHSNAPVTAANMDRTLKVDVETPISVNTVADQEVGVSIPALIGGCLAFPCTLMSSCWVLQPNTEAVIVNCGVYTGHVTEPGCHISNSCGREIRIIGTANISYDLPSQKITDSTGNPLIVSAVITYRFTNGKRALFNVQDAVSFVNDQAAAALKTVVGRYTYEELKVEGEHIGNAARELLQKRVDVAGATIISVSLNELNYAQEIAGAMLKSQAAKALVDARHLIVKGALSIATAAVTQLEEQGLKMTDDQKFHLVSSLLVVTAGDHDVHPTLGV